MTNPVGTTADVVRTKLLCIVGPTASGKSARAVDEALIYDGEILSVDSRQVYRRLDIGTEKISLEARKGVPHHLIDSIDIDALYSAGDFVHDATRLIQEITTRGKLPILVGGSHFYFDALLRGLPDHVPIDVQFRQTLSSFSNEELYRQIQEKDPRRAASLDSQNRRRLIRALEIIVSQGTVPERPPTIPIPRYDPSWIVMDPPREELRRNIDTRLLSAFARGLIDEIRWVNDTVGRTRLNEFGLEYRTVGEYLYGERSESSLLPTLSAQLWQYARRQKAWLRKLRDNNVINV